MSTSRKSSIDQVQSLPIDAILFAYVRGMRNIATYETTVFGWSQLSLNITRFGQYSLNAWQRYPNKKTKFDNIHHGTEFQASSQQS